VITHPTGLYPGMHAGYVAGNVPKFKKIVDAVHKYDAKIFVQFSHMGNQTKSWETSRPTWAPSNVPDLTVGEVPKALTLEEIKELEDSFVQSAATTMQAGFDGLEIKVAHDGILGQFVSLTKNKRTDQYGGSLENHVRIVVEILKALRERMGDVPIGVRLCINRYVQGDYGVNEALVYAKLIAAVADYISIDSGTWESIDMLVPSMNVPQGFMLQDIARIKKETGAIIIGNGRLVWPAMAEQALEDGTCDLVGMARALIADPFWANKAKAGKADEIRGCLGCNQKCMGRLLQHLGCRQQEGDRQECSGDGQRRQHRGVGNGGTFAQTGRKSSLGEPGILQRTKCDSAYPAGKLQAVGRQPEPHAASYERHN